MGYIFALITIILYVLYVSMLLRMLFDWVRMFAPELAPQGHCVALRQWRVRGDGLADEPVASSDSAGACG